MATELIDRATLDEVLHEVSRVKDVVTEAVDQGFKSALRTIKQGRHAAEDVIDDTRHAVKQNPFQAMGIVFAAGVMTGAVAAWLSTRRS
jgi:ElaB/YqjD/DUF883 family membrane-anchored ribosome-binding protein